MKKKSVPAETGNHPRKLPIGFIVDLTVTALDPEGFGVAVHEGKAFRVTGALPGEEVRAKITFSGKVAYFATVVKVHRRSNRRLISPPCDKLMECDGCPLAAMNYSAQLAWKKELVEREIGRYPTLQKACVHEVTPSPQRLGYRNSVKLVIGGKHSEPLVGIYRRHSHDIIDISSCPLHHPLVNRIILAVKEGVKKGKVPIYSLRSMSGLLRYLVVRVSSATNQAMVIFVTAERSYNEIHHLAKYLLEKVSEVKVVVQNVNSSAGNVILGKSDHFLTPARTLPERIGAVRFTISPRSFFQINPAAAELLYEKVKELGAPGGTDKVVDLYCGVGGISLFLASGVREVHGIEVVEAAVSDAEENAQLNGIENCRFSAGDAAELLKELAVQKVPVELLVVNPPRKGCDPQVLSHALALGAERIVYVSCSPYTLARDLDLLSKQYTVKEVHPVDMFPQTPHIENVVLLLKR